MRLFALRSVLVASDLGEPSLPAVRTGIGLAGLAGARLHLVHVAGASTADGESRLRDHARLAATDDDLRISSLRVMVGAPSTAIVEQARLVDADVIVLGPHRRDSRSAALGTTATEVVDMAACPCLVVAGSLRLPLAHVMAPVDLSAAAGGSLAVALTWASALRRPTAEAELTVLHVSSGSAGNANGASLRREVERIEAWAGGVAKVRIRQRVVSSANPANEILQQTADGAVDLVVIGTGAAAAERGSAERRVGDVTKAVIRDASCPVLLVPPRVWRARGVT